MAETTKVRNRRPGLGRRRSRLSSQRRLHPRYKDHVWNCAFVEAQTPDGEPFEVLAILDGYTLECLSISADRQISLENIVDRLFDLLVLREIPKYIVLGSGSESVSEAVAEWLSHLSVETAVAEPDGGWEEDGAWLLGTRLRDEVLASPTFATLPEARTLLGNWKGQYNETRPQHSPIEDEPQASRVSGAAISLEAELPAVQTLQPKAGEADPTQPGAKSPSNGTRQDGWQTRMPKWVVKAAKVAEYVGIALVVVLMTMVVLAMLAPHFGWRADTVLSGSMEPALPVGCVQVTKPVKPEDIKVGDIITFRSTTNGKLMSHRVTAVEVGESYRFRTKGDANEDVDPYLVVAENVVGRVCFKVPHVGYVVEYLKTPIGFILLGLIGIALIVAEISTMLEVHWKEPAQADAGAKRE
ncbi:MAG: signal peptidase I [Dehalococcoidia bacterium]|nr:signal peptidase I [Dehalococcoidia bacterium]